MSPEQRDSRVEKDTGRTCLQRESLGHLGVPQHLGIIMDGNGRWADRRGLPKTDGHREGVRNIRRIVQHCVGFGIQMLTLYAFSTENWGRNLSEIRGLMQLAEEYSSEVEELHRQGVRIRHLGSREDIAPQLDRLGMDWLGHRIPQRIAEAVELTKDNTGFALNIAFNYGSRQEIVRAARRLIQEGIPAEKLRGDQGEQLLERYLWTKGLPDPDLIVRTGGEMRLSNFLLWQAAYSEFWATPILWPEFGADELYRALIAYSMRERRYGGRRPQDADI